MPDSNEVLIRLTKVEMRLAEQERRNDDFIARLAEHEKRHDEFMLRTDKRLEVLISQSDEWAGVRKTLFALATVLTLVGGFVGWIMHEFWPKGLP